MILEIEKSISSLATQADDAKDTNPAGAMQLSQAVLNLANARAVIKHTDIQSEIPPGEAAV